MTHAQSCSFFETRYARSLCNDLKANKLPLYSIDEYQGSPFATLNAPRNCIASLLWVYPQVACYVSLPGNVLLFFEHTYMSWMVFQSKTDWWCCNVWRWVHLPRGFIQSPCDIYDKSLWLTMLYFVQHIMVDLGTGNNNKINWAMTDKQDFIDIVESVYRGARKGRGLVISPKDYSTKYRYWHYQIVIVSQQFTFFSVTNVYKCMKSTPYFSMLKTA